MKFRRSLSFLAALTALGSADPEPVRADALPPAPSAILLAPAAPAAPADAGNAATEDELAPPLAPEDEPAEAAPAAPAVHAPAAAPEKRRAPAEYVVQTGDTLGGIAHRHGLTAGALAAANGIGKDAPIRVGQKLVIPGEGQHIRSPARLHEVESGNTLGGIARRYGVTIDALLEANHLRKTDRLRIGQKLVIPGEGAARLTTTSREDPEDSQPSNPGMQTLAVSGAAPAYYFEPTGPGRSGMRPVIMYLHGRGADPASYCRRWARVARNLGWVVCPAGPEDRGDGKRGWNNNWAEGRHVVVGALDALRRKYGRRVQLFGNTLIGFSEGAYVAMNVGLREPKTFNRWLILGADTDYWGASGMATLPEAKGRVRRVYLITGRHDDVVEDAAEVRRWLLRAGVPVRVSTPKDMGHEVALEAKSSMYEAALRWLAQG